MVIIGGDFNCTHNPSLNRFCTTDERRKKMSLILQNLYTEFSLCDVWRRLNPNLCKFTWFRNSQAKLTKIYKSRLDCFYVPVNLMPSVISCDIKAYALSDYSVVILKVKLPTLKQKGSAYWHFNNSMLEDKTYKDIVYQFWKNWQTQKSKYASICNWKVSHQVNNANDAKVAKDKRDMINKLNESIDDLQSAPELTPETIAILKEQCETLSSILKRPGCTDQIALLIYQRRYLFKFFFQP